MIFDMITSYLADHGLLGTHLCSFLASGSKWRCYTINMKCDTNGGEVRYEVNVWTDQFETITISYVDIDRGYQLLKFRITDPDFKVDDIYASIISIVSGDKTHAANTAERNHQACVS